jgi:hypothetical protein
MRGRRDFFLWRVENLSCAKYAAAKGLIQVLFGSNPREIEERARCSLPNWRACICFSLKDTRGKNEREKFEECTGRTYLVCAPHYRGCEGENLFRRTRKTSIKKLSVKQLLNKNHQIKYWSMRVSNYNIF